MDDTRAQSELVGFVMIFGIVVLTIGLVVTTGFVGFQSAQDYQRTANAEQAVSALAHAVEENAFAGAPSRSTEIGLMEASMAVETTNTTLTVEDGDGPHEVTTGSVVYTADDTTLAYRNGAIIRSDDGETTMLREPPFVLSEDEVILPVIRMSDEEGGTVGGTSAITVRTSHEGASILTSGETDEPVTLTMATDHPETWAAYFEESSPAPVTEVDTTDQHVIVTLETDRLSVTTHRIDVRFVSV